MNWKYIVTIVMHCACDEVATNKLQAAADAVNAAGSLIQIAHVQRVDGAGISTKLETIQVLKPEDFDTWREENKQ